MRTARYAALSAIVAVGLATAPAASASEANVKVSAVGLLACTEAYIDGGNWLNWYSYVTCVS